MHQFGAGSLWGFRNDISGSGIGPDQFGVLQNVSFDFSFEVRELYGQYQFPVDIGRGKGKINGKAQFAEIYGAIYGDLFFGSTPAAGMTTVMDAEAGTVPSAVAYTITVAQAATYVDDLGVVYASGANAGNRFTRVTTPSAAGDYSVNTTTGVYTFSADDASAAVTISYVYTLATGKKITITNQLMGYAPTFIGTFYSERSSQGVALRLNSCVATSLSLPTRNDDFQIDDFSFSAFADASGNVGTLSMAE